MKKHPCRPTLVHIYSRKKTHITKYGVSEKSKQHGCIFVGNSPHCCKILSALVLSVFSRYLALVSPNASGNRFVSRRRYEHRGSEGSGGIFVFWLVNRISRIGWQIFYFSLGKNQIFEQGKEADQKLQEFICHFYLTRLKRIACCCPRTDCRWY